MLRRQVEPETRVDGLMRGCGGVGHTPISRWEIHCDPGKLRDPCRRRAQTLHTRERATACGTGVDQAI